MKRLPSVHEIGVNFANVDVTREAIPVVPTIHYQMGGIPTNIHGQVVMQKGRQPQRPGHQRSVRGGRVLLRVSVHGANRLGTNSLLDLLVFGRAAGNHIVEFNDKNKNHKDPCLPTRPTSTLARLATAWTTPPTASTRRTSRTTSVPRCRNMPACSAPRPCIDQGVTAIAGIRERVNAHQPQGQVQGVQHRTYRGAGGREPDRGRAGHHRLRRRAARKPRRPFGGRLRRHAGTPERPQRHRLAQAHPVVQRGQPPEPTSRFR